MLKKIICVVAISIFSFASIALCQEVASDQPVAIATTDGNAQSYLGFSLGDISSNNVNEPMRMFVIPGEVTYPNAPSVFHQPNQKDYMNHQSLLEYMEWEIEDGGFTIKEQKSIRSSKYFGRRVMVRSKYGKADWSKRLPEDQVMPIYFSKEEAKKAGNFKRVGQVTVLSDSKGCILADVFADAQIEAWEMGDENGNGTTALHIAGEGFHVEMRNHGEGIGFTFTLSGIDSSLKQASGATGVLGAGIADGNAGYYKHPYLIINALVEVEE